MERTEVAINIFEDGFNCAQSVVAAFLEETGLPERTAYRIACGFGAGMGRRQQTCGAITGGIMVIGMKYGRDAGRTDRDKEKTYQVVVDFMHEFEKRHATTECRDLLGCDLTTVEGKKHSEASHLHSTVCVECVKDAVTILDGLLA
jgi:C_GCAxxG_C_C family probable redox protein